jgi:hypothetical protein
VEKLLNHVKELKTQTLNNSDTTELFRGRDARDRQKGSGKHSGDDRGRESRDRNDKNDKRDRKTVSA